MKLVYVISGLLLVLSLFRYGYLQLTQGTLAPNPQTEYDAVYHRASREGTNMDYSHDGVSNSVNILASIPIQYQGPQQACQRVVQTMDEWRAMWPDTPESDIPIKFDPKTQTALGIFIGERPTAGYAVQIDSITETPDSLRVLYYVSRPDPNMAVAQVITYPGIVVLIPRTDKRVIFQEISGAGN